MAAICHVNCHSKGPHTHTVIFLHERDSEAEEFASEFFESEASKPANKPRTLLDLFPTIRWVFPSAPILQPRRFDTTMSQWFDMWSVEDPDMKSELQRDSLHESVASILEVIKQEEALLPRDRIFLGGISQGFATALSIFFAGGQGLGGLIGLCSWMPLGISTQHCTNKSGDIEGIFQALQKLYTSQPTRSVDADSMRSTPIFLGLRNVLRVCMPVVYWHNYESGGHCINEPQGLDDIVEFLNARIQSDGYIN
ncbi:lysophospholipase II [Pseudomassariella vexata]|uniref:Lysophospholipase II n=1 Tax=Pseudomassariella vexata TaxID=1141098 RepID=A0A1Y2E7H3_9PEZI|nr:lysophospholipase II [Pseudomassariella vexata]ORY67492.1 lysophospholipase II [Pseudomassariella vexata]